MPAGQALLRSGARAGDDLWVSGTLGDARLALEVFRGSVALPGAGFEAVRRAMELPQPRVALGLALRGVASSAIDLSDGLVGDLGHVLQRSGVGAMLHADALPRSAVLAAQPPACSANACWPAATTTSCSSPRRRRGATPCWRPRRRPAWRSRAAARSRPGRRCASWMRPARPLPLHWHGFDHFA